MKNLKLLAALAVPAMFAACTEQEIVSVETPQKMMEVVGGELIGIDVTIDDANLNEMQQTRYTGGESTWDKDDKIGLGWIPTNGGPSGEQSTTGTKQDKLYANHMFEYSNETGFYAKGNLYKGWHFAYYPYDYMEAVGTKVFEINPAMESKIYNDDNAAANWNKRVGQKFYISALQFLTRESMDENYRIKKEVNLVPQSPVANLTMRLTAAPGSQFATVTNLKNYVIESVTIKAGAQVFAPYAQLMPSQLHAYNATLDLDADKSVEVENKEALINSFANSLVAGYLNESGEFVAGRQSEMTTNVEAADYTVGGGAGILAYVLPMNAATTLDAATVSVEVVAGGGKFVIAYDAAADAPKWKKENNDAIAALIAAYAQAADGKGGELLQYNSNLNLAFHLHEDDFVAVWDGIEDAYQWNKKVALATDLAVLNPTFTLAKNAKIVFTGEENQTMSTPEGMAITVNAHAEAEADANGENFESRLIVDYDCTWNNKINVGDNISVQVNKNRTLTVDGNATLQPQRVFNEGNIVVKPGSTVGCYGSNEGWLFNYGTVTLEWGAFVYVHSSKHGIIQYIVTEDDLKDPSRIKYLTATTTDVEQTKLANVNTLIVDGIALDFSAQTVEGGTENAGNPYAPGKENVTKDQYAYYGDNLAGVDFIVKNNGVIKSSNVGVVVEGTPIAPTTVKNVTLEDGASIQGGIIIAGNLTNTGKGAVEVNQIDGTVKTNGKVIANYIGRGIVEANNCIIKVNTISEGGIQSATGSQITATTSIQGDINATNCVITTASINGTNVTVNACDINAGQINAAVVANGNTNIVAEAITGNVTLNGETVIDGAEITGDVTVNGTSTLVDVKINGTLTVAKNATVTINSDGNVYITNIVNDGTLKSDSDIYVTNVTLKKSSTTTLTDEDEENRNWNKTIYFSGVDFIDQMTLNGTVLKYTLTSYDENKSAEDNGSAMSTALKAAKSGTAVYATCGEYKFASLAELNTGVSIIADKNTVLEMNYFRGLYYSLDKDTKNLTLKNIEVIAANDRETDKNCDIWFRFPSNHDTPNQVVNITLENVKAKRVMFESYYADGVTFNVELINCDIEKVDAHAFKKAGDHVFNTYVNVVKNNDVNVVPGGNAPENVKITKI